MTHTLATRSDTLMPAPADWAVMLEMAKQLVDSGLLPTTIKTPAAAVAIITKGIELGVPPMHALSSIVVIQGKPTCSAELMAALIYRDHGDEALVFTEAGDTRCTVTYKRRGWSSRQSYSFSMADAARAGLADKGEWKKYPAAMLRARTISAVARMAFPDTIGGLYLPSEMGAEVTVTNDGEVVIVQETIARDTDAEIRPGVVVLIDELNASLGDDEPEDQRVVWAAEDIHDWLASLTDRRDLPAVRQAINASGLDRDDAVMSDYTRIWERLTGKKAAPGVGEEERSQLIGV